MKNKNHITIQGWMINELNLSGSELLCYALIYGFSQDGESSFNGSRKYIAKLIGAKSLNTVDKYLDTLIENKLIIKTSSVHNGVISNSYIANLNLPCFLDCTPCSKIEHPYSKIEHNNNSNIDSNKEKEIDKSISKKKNNQSSPTDEEHQIFEEFRRAYQGKKRGHDTEFYFFIAQNKDWREVLPKLSLAVTRENVLREQARSLNKFFPEPKNLQTYLNGKNRAWEVFVDDSNNDLFTNNDNEKTTTKNDILVINGVCYK